jgi:outer membrane protein assembly factor BamD (BamD/ComL family)
MTGRFFKFLFLPFIPGILLFIQGCNEKVAEKETFPKKDTIVRRDPHNFQSDCRDLYNKAREMDSTLQQQLQAETGLGNQAIGAFTDYAYYCNNDSLSPIFLIKSAQVARAISNIPQAQKSLQYCIDNYRNSPHRPAAIFLLGQLHEDKTYLNDRDEALRLYQQVIDEYPKSDWAQSAKGAIAMMGKSDEEIIRFLKNKK